MRDAAPRFVDPRFIRFVCSEGQNPVYPRQKLEECEFKTDYLFYFRIR
ncbi:MAG: hypothetical protein QG657_5342 [Acidobacteriota bacterium]|nr:hypothetical protein [Acidobacteriota bacterium]